MKTISVVTPCFNEEGNIRECYLAVRKVFEDSLPGYRREHVFCDNSSTDNTVSILKEIAKEDPGVRIIVNARNFGPMRSNYNGVLATMGDCVLLFLPADLQDPPEMLPEFVRLWESGFEVVYGIRAVREESPLMRRVRGLYYRLLTASSDLQIPPGVGDFQLVDRKVINAMRQIDDVYPFMRMMTFECGFRSIGVSYTWKARQRGISKNRIHHLLDQGMNGFVTFTKIPMRIALYGGIVVSILSVLYAVINFIIAILFYHQISNPGIMTLIVAIFFFGGVQMFFLGILGEYVLQIYAQVRRTPLVIERERVNFDDPMKPVE
ncbi:MAG: glycosyltransferase family 2 protein [Alphaproteobacteria bacterium]|nr:glycosyltransferase family 2 protein [Alphaproteobacteria bacterium]